MLQKKYMKSLALQNVRSLLYDIYVLGILKEVKRQKDNKIVERGIGKPELSSHFKICKKRHVGSQCKKLSFCGLLIRAPDNVRI